MRHGDYRSSPRILDHVNLEWRDEETFLAGKKAKKRKEPQEIRDIKTDVFAIEGSCHIRRIVG